MTHQVSMENLQDYEFTYEIAGAFGKDENKVLQARVKNDTLIYEVTLHRKIIATYDNLRQAINAYNAI